MEKERDDVTLDNVKESRAEQAVCPKVCKIQIR